MDFGHSASTKRTYVVTGKVMLRDILPLDKTVGFKFFRYKSLSCFPKPKRFLVCATDITRVGQLNTCTCVHIWTKKTSRVEVTSLKILLRTNSECALIDSLSFCALSCIHIETLLPHYVTYEQYQLYCHLMSIPACLRTEKHCRQKCYI